MPKIRSSQLRCERVELDVNESLVKMSPSCNSSASKARMSVSAFEMRGVVYSIEHVARKTGSG